MHAVHIMIFIIKLCQSYKTCPSRTGHSWVASVGNTSQHQTTLGISLKMFVKNFKWITRYIYGDNNLNSSLNLNLKNANFVTFACTAGFLGIVGCVCDVVVDKLRNQPINITVVVLLQILLQKCPAYLTHLHEEKRVLFVSPCNSPSHHVAHCPVAIMIVIIIIILDYNKHVSLSSIIILIVILIPLFIPLLLLLLLITIII